MDLLRLQNEADCPTLQLTKQSRKSQQSGGLNRSRPYRASGLVHGSSLPIRTTISVALPALLTQSLNVRELGEITVIRPYRQMPGLSRNLEHQAIREIHRRPRTKMNQRRGDHPGVLQGQLLVIEQHIDGG